MSYWPFVSRARFDDKVARISELEAENRLIHDRILQMMGAKPLYAHVEIRPVIIESDKPAKIPTPQRNRPTFTEISFMATDAKRKEHEAVKLTS